MIIQDDTNILSDYGNIFQHKLLSLLLIDKPFFEQMYEILNPRLFTSESLKWISSITQQHYLKFHELPVIESFKVYIKQDALNETQKFNVVQSLKDAFKYQSATDLPLVKEKSLEFFKNKNFERVLLESVDDLKLADYDKIYNNIENAMKAGINADIGHNYKKDVVDRYKENIRHTIPTGWDVVDRYLDGGLGKKEFGIILSMSSVGKTWVLCHMALNAAKQGKLIAFANLEDDSSYIGARLDSINTRIDTHNLKYDINKITDIANKVLGNVFIKDFPMDITTTINIKTWFDKLSMIHKKPDLLMIDYGGVMAPIRRHGQNWLDQKQIFVDIKSLAQILNIPIWSADQANLTAENQDIIEATKMSQAYLKVAPCNVILSLSRKPEDALANTGRLYIAKNKFGPDKVILPCKINNSKGVFDVYDEHTEEGKVVNEQMKYGDELLKQRLSKVFQNMKEE